MTARARPAVRPRTGRSGALLLALGAACALATPAAGCGGGAPDELPALRAGVEALRDSLARRLEGEPRLATFRADTGHVMVGISVPFLKRVLHVATLTYLDDVRLHLRPDAVVREGEEVRVSVGPFRVTAGRWDVRVTIQEIRARLRADTVDLTVADSTRLDVAVPVHVLEGSGRARIDFTWDATAAASVVCRDFRVSEVFEGRVSPRSYRLEAALVLEHEGEGLVARPRYTGRRLSITPEPTPAAWRRVRELLDRQNSIFRCGLALSPDGMEELLRNLLREGFRFEFPESILQPVPLPASVHERLEVEGRSFVLGVRPVTVRLTPETLWYSLTTELLDRMPVEARTPPW